MTSKSLPLFESIAAVFGIAVVALLVALPSTGTSAEESTERLLRENLRQVRTAVRELVESGETVPSTSEELQAILCNSRLSDLFRRVGRELNVEVRDYVFRSVLA